MSYLTIESYHMAATPMERIALYNGATEIRIYREDSEWRVSHASCALSAIHMPIKDGFRTMGAALDFARKSFPNLPIWRESYGGEDNAKRRALHMPSATLEELEGKGALYTDSQDIESALAYADKRALAWHGIAPADVTGVVETLERDSSDVMALHVTTSSRPWAIASSYVRAL